MAAENRKSKKLSLSADMVKRAAQSAAQKTDKQLASRIAELTHITEEEVAAAFPDKIDLERVEELMKIVKSDADQQEKLNAFLENPQKYARVALTLLGKFV